MHRQRFVSEPGARAKTDPHARVKRRLESWGRWIELSQQGGHLPSSLTLDPNRIRHALPRFVPVSEVECAETDAAIAKLPQQVRAVAVAEYVAYVGTAVAARKIGVSERHYRRLREMLHNGVAYCLRHPGVPVPPAQVLLKPVAAD